MTLHYVNSDYYTVEFNKQSKHKEKPELFEWVLRPLNIKCHR